MKLNHLTMRIQLDCIWHLHESSANHFRIQVTWSLVGHHHHHCIASIRCASENLRHFENNMSRFHNRKWFKELIVCWFLKHNKPFSYIFSPFWSICPFPLQIFIHTNGIFQWTILFMHFPLISVWAVWRLDNVARH